MARNWYRSEPMKFLYHDPLPDGAIPCFGSAGQGEGWFVLLDELGNSRLVKGDEINPPMCSFSSYDMLVSATWKLILNAAEATFPYVPESPRELALAISALSKQLNSPIFAFGEKPGDLSTAKTAETYLGSGLFGTPFEAILLPREKQVLGRCMYSINDPSDQWPVRAAMAVRSEVAYFLSLAKYCRPHELAGQTAEQMSA